MEFDWDSELPDDQGCHATPQPTPESSSPGSDLAAPVSPSPIDESVKERHSPLSDCAALVDPEEICDGRTTSAKK